MNSKSHINDGVRSALAKQSPEIRAGVLATADNNTEPKPNTPPTAVKPQGARAPTKPMTTGR